MLVDFANVYAEKELLDHVFDIEQTSIDTWFFWHRLRLEWEFN